MNLYLISENTKKSFDFKGIIICKDFTEAKKQIKVLEDKMKTVLLAEAYTPVTVKIKLRRNLLPSDFDIKNYKKFLIN